MEKNCVLQVDSISKHYIDSKKQSVKAVDSVSFKAYKGEILGLLGGNGAGKTTTIKMICSLIKPNEGSILINGFDNFKKRTKSLKYISAVLEGNRNIYWQLTVRENLEFFATLKGINPKNIKDKIDFYIKEFSLKDKENTVASNISRGMQQKLSIAIAMVSQSDVILLDEPTLGLDVESCYEIRSLLKEIAKKENKAIILSSHDMNVIQDVCDRVIIMDKGKIIVEDKIENLMRLFNVKKYNFIIDGKLSEYQKEALDRVEHLNMEQADECVKISLNLENISTFYDVISILNSEKSIITSIESKELNFEEVFMKILVRSEYRDDAIV